MRHVKTGKVIWATPQWLKLAQEMKEMHLWEKVSDQNEVAKLKFEVPGVMAASEPAHEVVEVEPVNEPASEATNEQIELQQNIVEDKPKKSNKK